MNKKVNPLVLKLFSSKIHSSRSIHLWNVFKGVLSIVIRKRKHIKAVLNESKLKLIPSKRLKDETIIERQLTRFY